VVPAEATAIGGLTMGADPVAFGVAAIGASRGRALRSFSVRKEAKDHGEGGVTIGAPLAGRVIIIDDVISAGTSVRESVQIIDAAGAAVCAVAIALDRMERGTGTESAAQEVQRRYRIPVVSIANLDDLISFLSDRRHLARQLRNVEEYRSQYGAL